MIYYNGNYFDLLVGELQKIYPNHKISYIVNDCPKCTVLFDGLETTVKISSSISPTLDPWGAAFDENHYYEMCCILAEHLCQWRFRDKNILKSDGTLLGKWWERQEFKSYFEKKKQRLGELK